MTDDLAQEQEHLDLLYARVDALRARTAAALAEVRRAPSSGTPASRSERDAFAALHSERLAALAGVEERLCFGRLDLVDGARRYVGRIGLADDEQRQLLVDWRAPAAEPFYQATAASPRGVVRRRHLLTRGRTVDSVSDEVLDLSALPEGESAPASGDSALLAAVTASRTGRMRDIVATVQAEQDRIIRAPLPGVLVVQGGPGTGKTAVALHRAAYLLYTHRDRLARRGVLLVGPNAVFLRYIEQVLPSLGETGVLLSTPAQLFPGVEATGEEPPEVSALKGDLRMADVVAAAVRARQRVPPRPLRLDVDGTTVVLHPEVVERARTKARRSRAPHNVAREHFVKDVLRALARRYADALGVELNADERGSLETALRDSRDVRREVNLCWMPVSPARLLADLYADPDRLAVAAPHLSPAERRLLARPRGSAWTAADVPLLDEAAELLGEVGTPGGAAEAAAAAARREELAYAGRVLETFGGAGIVDVEMLADRYAGDGPSRTVGERAAEDRAWQFGHVVVDEAQELSPMLWRLLLRRCPARSMTVVGDVAQTSSASGAGSWAAVLDRLVPGRWRVEELSVNYRTPRQVMDVAADVLAAAGLRAPVPESVRDAADPPSATRLAAGDDAGLVGAVRDESAAVGDGRLAVVTSRADAARVAAVLVAALGGETVGVGPQALDAPVTVLDVTAAKGLEFDGVVLVEPAHVLAESPRGANDLYVALTRPTQRLRVLHSEPLPPGMERLEPASAGS